MNKQEFLNWMADRLVHVYGESPNVDFVLALRRYANEPQVVKEPTNYETNKALMEAHRNESSEAYWAARKVQDTGARRVAFEAGFDRGWEAHKNVREQTIADAYLKGIARGKELANAPVKDVCERLGRVWDSHSYPLNHNVCQHCGKERDANR